MTDIFARYKDEDVRDLIAEYPLAWLLANEGRADLAAQLPLLGEYDVSGKLRSLFGHIPLRHPLVPILETDKRALALFNGPQAYISPDQAGLTDWAPTWNFAQLSIEVELAFVPEETGAALVELVDRMERRRPVPWTITALGQRYASMENRVIGFRAQVTRVVGRFKLGQDERPDVCQTIIRSLGDAPLADWMLRFSDRARDGESR